MANLTNEGKQQLIGTNSCSIIPGSIASRERINLNAVLEHWNRRVITRCYAYHQYWWSQ